MARIFGSAERDGGQGWEAGEVFRIPVFRGGKVQSETDEMENIES